jgi:hypothetical protein
MLERDAEGRVRTSSLSDPWQPDFASLDEQDARAYIEAELGWVIKEARRVRWWWEIENGWLAGRTPATALTEGDYEEVWRAATALRESTG